MGKSVANVTIFVACLAVVIVAIPWLQFAWLQAFVSDRSFTAYFGFVTGGALLEWLGYIWMFFVSGFVLAALLRTNRPYGWVIALGVAFSAYRLAFSTNHVLHPSVYLYATIVGSYLAPAVGAALGALAYRKLRIVPPNNSSKPTPLRGAA